MELHRSGKTQWCSGLTAKLKQKITLAFSVKIGLRSDHQTQKNPCLFWSTAEVQVHIGVNNLMSKISKTPATLQAESTEDNNLPDPRQLNMYSEPPKIPTETLEKALSDRLSRLSGFKALSSPCAILEHSQDEVLVGVPKDMVGPLYSNYTLKSGLEQAVGAVFKRPGVRVKTRQADPECEAARTRLEALKRAEEKLEREKQEVDRQKEMGKCDIIPFPRNEEKLRSDVTLSKFPLFVSNNYKGSEWSWEREGVDPDGTRVKFVVQVGNSETFIRGVLKQRHQELLYFLLKLWGERGYPISDVDGFICGGIRTSLYELVVGFTGGDRGSDYKTMRTLLQELSAAPVSIKKNNLENDTYEIDEFRHISFNLKEVGIYTWFKTGKQQRLTQISIRFSAFLTENFLRKKVKQISFDQYKKIGSRNSRRSGFENLVCDYLEYHLSTKEGFRVALESVFKRFGEPCPKYKSRWKTRAKPLLSLNGLPIVAGKYKLQVSIQETADGKGYNLVSKRI